MQTKGSFVKEFCSLDEREIREQHLGKSKAMQLADKATLLGKRRHKNKAEKFCY